MSTIKVTNLFTAVGFFVVTVFGQPGHSAETMEQCKARIIRAAKKICTQPDPKDKQACLSSASMEDTSECDELNSKEDRNAGDSDCEAAFKEYKDSLADANSACESVAGTSTATTDTRKKCSDKIKECAQFAQQSSAQTAQPDNGISNTLNIFSAVLGGQSPLGSTSTDSCLVDVDSKEARDAEKEFRDRRKELEKEKKEIEDDSIKDKEDNDKEITRITKEIQELARNNKETLAKADVKMREQLNASQKDMVDSSSRLRNLTTQISKKNDSARQLNFSYADRMLDTSAQKQNLRCKSALDQAKTCMIKSTKGIKDEACKDFPFKISSKGPKATAELKAQLQVVNDACYEKEDRDKKKLNFDQQEQMKRINDEITELQAQAKEESQRQTIQSENSTKITQEAEREKQEAQANMSEQQATLQSEMSQFAEKLALKNQKAQERLKKLAEDLQKLELEEKTGKRSKTSLASAAVRKTSVDVENVVAQCGCNPDIANAKAGDEAPKGSSTKSMNTCKALKRSLPSGGEERKTRTGKSTSAF